MATTKEITVVRYNFDMVGRDWAPEVDLTRLGAYLAELHAELSPLGIRLSYREEADKNIEVKGYGDLLNTIRLRSPKDHIGNLCLGHIIGKSANCDIFEDVRRGVCRIAFAPEMIEPEGSHKTVCHNCGCGC